ncbi:MAG: cytochrome C oxidase subunit III [Bacteroidia bacterium]|nr:cytochrome C oxidase subunit III [Bacteroidia bacterium]
MEQLHPFKTMMFFGLVASTLIFLAFVFLYTLRIPELKLIEDFQFPKAFIVSTVLLMFSSFSLSKVIQSFKNDNIDKLVRQLGITLILGFAFIVSQIKGWQALSDAGFYLSGQSGLSFLYLISGFHLLHVVGGMAFLLLISLSAYAKSKDGVQSLLYLSDQLQLTKLELITIYWHFIDFLWICLFFIFLFSFS